MTEDQNQVEPGWEGGGMPSRLPEWAWPVAIAATFLIVFGLFHLSSRSYEQRSEGRFLGPETCREWHQEQYDSWAETKMANSFEVLLPDRNVEEKRVVGLDPEVDYSREEVCLPCHTTGYGLVGGFVSMKDNSEMAGISCEACHEHGGTYVNTVMDPESPTFPTAEAAAEAVAGVMWNHAPVMRRAIFGEGKPWPELSGRGLRNLRALFLSQAGIPEETSASGTRTAGTGR